MSDDDEVVDDQLRLFRETYGYDWPTCSIPDCGHKVCVWATEFYCAPHSLELLGPEQMIQRWNDSHPDMPWSEPFPPGSRPS